MEGHILRLSEALYIGLCGELGSSTQIKIRRDVMDTEDIIRKLFWQITTKTDLREMISGSFREGFRIKTSDINNMLWSTKQIIIYDLTNIPPYHSTQTVFLMECHDTPPGFAKLKLLTQTNNPVIRKSCVSVKNQMYISSSLYKEALHSAMQQIGYGSFIPHGPCMSGFLDGKEHDFAICFSCQHWPPSIYQWIERCQRNEWPSSEVLQDIISDGCHLVAIGSGRSTSPQQVETEWRMSFSQAEYKLVSSMNHAQFLCYGLLKIFLKEVLNDGLENPLLCSYFMKTTLFWKVQENASFHWSSQNFLHCVWLCFKYLIQCVYRGELPNFFIPQNNMFLNKIHGFAQKQLFSQLLNLYNMGISCLLLSPTLHHILAKAILNLHLQVSSIENNSISEAELDIELFSNIKYLPDIACKMNLDQCFQFIKSIDNIYNKNLLLSENQIVILHLMRKALLVQAAFHLKKKTEDNFTDIRPLDILISAAESGFISDTLYVALYHYNQARYIDALRYIETTKRKLNQPYVFDIHFPENVNREMYMEAVRGQPLIDKVKKALTSHVVIGEFCCFDEIILVEIRNNWLKKTENIVVPPLVMAHMLSFLCYHRRGDRRRSRQSLDDLQTLLIYGGGQYIPFKFGDMSWQWLEICEQIDRE